MDGQPVWYELLVPDAGTVADMYRAVLGWEIPGTGSSLPSGAEYRQIRRADGGNAGGLLTLTPQMQDAGARPGWLTYFQTGDVDGTVSRALALGAQLWVEPADMPGAGRMAMLSDPQGAPFYLLNPVPPPGQPDARSDVFAAQRPGHCWWNQLDTSDAGVARSFYRRIMGWQDDRTMPMGTAGDYRFIAVNGEDIGAINPMKPAGSPDGWLPFFGVADIDDARAAALAHGYTITRDVHQVPGGNYVIQGRDPANAAVAFCGPKGIRT